MPEDWKQRALEAWNAPSWKAPVEYRADHPTQPVLPSEQTKRLRQLMEENVSLERAWRELNKLRAVSVRPPKRQSSPPAIHFDKKLTLDQIIDTIRPIVADVTGSTKQHIRTLWAAAKASRACGASDVIHRAFMDLAVEANLIDWRGHWTGKDVRADLCRHGTEDVAHVITWALRGWNPFETGPLK